MHSSRRFSRRCPLEGDTGMRPYSVVIGAALALHALGGIPVQAAPRKASAVISSSASPVAASIRAPEQTSISSYELRLYSVGGTTPLAVRLIPLAIVSCNLTPTQTNNTDNPTHAEWDDLNNVGRSCQVALANTAGGNPIPTFPTGKYEGQLIAFGEDGSTIVLVSNRAPFERVGGTTGPGTISGFRIIR